MESLKCAVCGKMIKMRRLFREEYPSMGVHGHVKNRCLGSRKYADWHARYPNHTEVQAIQRTTSADVPTTSSSPEKEATSDNACSIMAFLHFLDMVESEAARHQKLLPAGWDIAAANIHACAIRAAEAITEALERQGLVAPMIEKDTTP